MSDNKDLQGFDLDDILNEFQDVSLDAADASEDLDSLLGDWLTADTAPADVPEKADEPAAPAADAVSGESAPMDTIRMNQLIAEIVDQTEAAEPVASEESTVRMDELTELHAEETNNVVSEDATINLEAVEQDVASFFDKTPAPEAPRIIYNPRTRLRELKKKLVAGPEKRYYELSEVSVAKLQTAILLNLALVVLCAIATTLYSLDMLSGNRLRFVIFTQILSTLLSAFLGCNQILDGIGDLFKGRFTINTMLFFSLIACCADGVFCLSELRIPCCAAFSLEMTMALWARYQRHSTEMAQMDTLRKAVRLNAMVKAPMYYENKAGILRREGEVEDFMDHYDAPSGPEKLQSFYAFISLLLCIAISVFAGMLHGVSMALQILSTSLLVAIPASFFVSITRPAALLERRLHMVGTVLCGWRGVKQLRGKVNFPIQDEDLFPANTSKLNGVKFYGDRNSDDVIACTTALISVAGGGLVNLFQKLLESRNGVKYPVSDFRDYGVGGIGGKVNGCAVLMGTMDFLQDMGIHIPEGTMVNQAVYAAIDGELCAVYAISYAKMRSAAAGIISLCGNRKLTPVMAGRDFMLTESLLRAKFSVNTRRIVFPDVEIRAALSQIQPDDSMPTLALATRDELAAYAYAVSGARALSLATKLGVAIHLVGGILGLLIMAALAFLGSTELLTPTHVLLYQLVWIVPGLLVTEWARTV